MSDIEGAEYMVFERDQETLRSVSVAIIETHAWAYGRFGGNLPKFLRLSEDAGLRVTEQRRDVVVLAR